MSLGLPSRFRPATATSPGRVPFITERLVGPLPGIPLPSAASPGAATGSPSSVWMRKQAALLSTWSSTPPWRKLARLSRSRGGARYWQRSNPASSSRAVPATPTTPHCSGWAARPSPWRRWPRRFGWLWSRKDLSACLAPPRALLTTSRPAVSSATRGLPGSSRMSRSPVPATREWSEPESSSLPMATGLQ